MPARKSSKPFVLLLNKRMVDDSTRLLCLFFQDLLAQAFEEEKGLRLTEPEQNVSAILVPDPNRCRKSLGCLKRVRPTSARGLTLMIVAPRRAALCRVASIRGWFVPGFCPIIRIVSARSKSSSLTVPFPTPMTSLRASPDRLVAHVGTIRQVVGAKLPHE